MATINGTADEDFIHRAGDGNVPPVGYNEITGVTTGNDVIDGKEGDDIIYGDGGNDTIIGGLGTDTMFGGDGNDRFLITDIAQIDGLTEFMDGGAGINQLRLEAIQGTLDLSKATLVNVRSFFGSALVGGLIVSLTPEQLSGFSSGITGSSASLGSIDFALSVSGLVELAAIHISGLDSITGSSGDDTLDISGAIDSIGVRGEAGDDSIKLDPQAFDAKSTSYSLEGGEGNDVLKLTTGIGTLTGGKGKDELFGGKRDDALFGNSSKDELTGRGHQDTLTGGGSADSFIYQKLKDSLPEADRHDTITDFSHEQGDRIDLHTIDADLVQAGDQPFFLGGSTFTGSPGELIQFIHAVSGDTILQGDVGGDGVADFEIALESGPVLVAADFVF